MGSPLHRLIHIPALHFLVALTAGAWAQSSCPRSLGLPSFEAALMLGIGLLLIAVSLAAAGIWQLRMHHTTVEPGGRPRALVARGVFSLSRNPLYVALLLAHLAIGIMADSPWIIGSAALLWLVLDRLIVPAEERALDAAFGESYRAYQGRVRRWL